MIRSLLFAGMLVPGIAAAQTGQISGRVTNTTGLGLMNVRIDFYQPLGSGWSPIVASATTDANGSYVRPGLVAGEYAVKTTNTALYVDEAYNDVICLGLLSECAGLTRVAVAAGGSVSNIDFVLSPGGGISGRVTDAAGTGLPNVLVAPYQKTATGGYTSLYGRYTDASGNYAITTGLPTGTYYLKTSNSVGYVDEVYNDVACAKGIGSCPPGTGVGVAQGVTTSSIDFALALGGRIAGRVTDGANTALQGVTVYVYEKTITGSYDYLLSISTDASGGYLTTTGLPTGTYYLHTANRAGYLDEVYDDVPCPGYRYIGTCAAGTGVSVSLGVTTSNTNFVLLPGGNISGRVTDVTGTGLSGVKVDFFEKTSGDSFSSVTSVYTDGSGNYTTPTGLPTGTYYLKTSNTAGYVDELYDDLACLGSTCPWSAATGVVVAQGVTTANTTFVLELPAARLPAGDYDGDGTADVAVYRPSTGAWYIIPSSTGTAVGFTWGMPGDVPAPADYDGDRKTDAAVFRPSTGTWYVLQTTGTAVGVSWGVASDVPVPADYDGDGKADVAVFRASTGTWYIVRSSGGTVVGLTWGVAGDVPVPADYDGDTKADPTVFRPASGAWYELRSTTGSGFGLNWGQAGDTPLAPDVDADGKADPTVFRAMSGTWYQLRSTTQSAFGVGWGGPGDQPMAGDYDGDGKADPTVFRPSSAMWYELRSTTGNGFGVVWGAPGDVPR